MYARIIRWMAATAIVLALGWPVAPAAAQEPSPMPYEVGEIAPFRTLCQPDGNGVVLMAFIEGGPELAEAAFDEQVAAGECNVYPFIIWAELEALGYIGLFHGYHLWTLRFGRDGFSMIYAPELPPAPAPPFNPNRREA